MKYMEGYVAFVDILGFSQLVLESQNIKKVNDLFSFVKKFCYLFNSSANLNVNASFFSDSIVICSSKFEKLILPIAIAENYLKSELGLLFRGGITKGDYFHNEGSIFGPAVVKAYQLEQNANFSRIILDSDIIDKLEDSIFVFEDIDGKNCLNLSTLIILDTLEKNQKMTDRISLANNLLDCFRKEREAILFAIKDHLETPVVEKYHWRIRPFNYFCEKIATAPTEIDGLKGLSQIELQAFSLDLRALKIADIENLI